MGKRRGKKRSKPRKAIKSNQVSPKTPLTSPEKDLTYFKRLRKLFSWIGSLVIAFASIIVFIVWPRVSMNIGETRNPYMPFETIFNIKNDGYLPVCDVEYSITPLEIETFDGTRITAQPEERLFFPPYKIDKIPANDSHAISFQRMIIQPRNAKKVRVCVNLTFRLWIIPYRVPKYFCFQTEIDHDKKYFWNHYFIEK